MKPIHASLFLVFFCFGVYLGFKCGYSEAKFDQVDANYKLQQCLDVIRK